MKLKKIPNGATLRPATTLPLELQELLSARGKTDKTLKHPIAKVLSPILMITLFTAGVFLIALADMKLIGAVLIAAAIVIPFLLGKTVSDKDKWEKHKYFWYQPEAVIQRVHNNQPGGTFTYDLSDGNTVDIFFGRHEVDLARPGMTVYVLIDSDEETVLGATLTDLSIVKRSEEQGIFLTGAVRNNLDRIAQNRVVHSGKELPDELFKALLQERKVSMSLWIMFVTMFSTVAIVGAVLSIIALLIKSGFMLLIALVLALIFGLIDIIFIKTAFKDMWKTFKDIRVRQFKWYEDTIVNKRVDRRTGGDDTLDTSAYVLEFYDHTVEVLPAVYNSLNKGDRAIVVLDMNNKICTALAAEIKA